MFNVSLGIKILILNSIGGQTILNFHWLLKDEGVMDWSERFPQPPMDKENKLKEGWWKGGKRSFLGVLFLCYFSWEGEEKDDES